MEVGGTRPWMVEGRTMQEAIVENDSGDKVEQFSATQVAHAIPG